MSKPWTGKAWPPTAPHAERSLRMPSWFAPQRTRHTGRTLPPGATSARHRTAPPVAPSVPPKRISATNQPAVVVGEDAIRASLQAKCAELAAEIEALHGENQSLRDALLAMTDTVAAAERAVLARSEPAVIELARTIAERVVGHELSADPLLIAQWARDAATTLKTKDPLTIAMAPDIAALLPQGSIEANFTVLIDTSLPPGGCEVRAGGASITASAAGRISDIVRSLQGDEG